MRRIAALKRLVITGGTGGLGNAIAHEFMGNDWEVIVLGKNDLDLSNRESVTQFFDNTLCDLLVCCAGVIRDVPLSRMEEWQWDDVFCLNYHAAARCAEAVLPWMLDKNSGHVIFISSYAASHPAVGQAAYASAKAALHGLAQDLTARHGSAGLRFNVVLPGFLETPMTDAVTSQRKEAIRKMHCLEKFNTVSAVARFIRFLEEQLPFTSGQVFSLDSRL